MNPHRHTDPLLIGFLTLSLLLHVVLFYLMPHRGSFPGPAPERPVTVELRPPVPRPEIKRPSPPLRQPRQVETDLPPQPPPPKPRTKPAKRLAAQDQQVLRETAPQGADREDLNPPTAAVPSPLTQAQPQGIQPPEPAANAAEAPTRVPSLQSLLTLPKSTTNRMVEELRRKHRGDVAAGDAVWLDTEQDLLASFFQRFKDGIYRVWNYPPRAAERGEEGVCLLKITIARDGSVKRVQILDPSGYPLLDNEALAAVRRAGPYGDLPRSYSGEELNIFAFFHYTLLRQHNRPGDIY